MIIAFHLTWTTYGHWFPNDPRGSWSEEVWKPELVRIRTLDDERKLTYTNPVHPQHLQCFLDSARGALQHPVIQLDAAEIKRVADAFRETTQAMKLRVFECALMSNHVHLVVERHPDTYERIVNRLKGRSAQWIRKARHLLATNRRERPPIWTEGYWVRYIDSVSQLEVAIEYVRTNPIGQGLAPQRWDFVEQQHRV